MRLILSLLVLVSICTAENESDYFFKGDHELLALNSFTAKTTQSKSEGSFFLFVGTYSSQSSVEFPTKVNFCWKNNKNEYLTSSLPIEKVRFQMDSTITKPFCKFRWRPEYNFVESNWVNYLVYVVFVVKPDQILHKDISLDLKK